MGDSAEKDRLAMSFEDITYTVRRKVFSKEGKDVLRGVSGEFQPGQLSVIVGPSGAGKSSLMDILAGYTKATSGRLMLNGRERDEGFFRQRACYIMQSDHLQPLLTVREALAVAAELKLGRHLDSHTKRRRVEEIIAALKLNAYDGCASAADTRTGSLSGGQRKRLAVGLELVSDPLVMLLDEPTSGLDSSTSKQMISLLRKLADQGRTLVVSIHQPSSALLSLMDRLYALHRGRCAYSGAVTELVPYLNESGFKCPSHHNPVDFLMEVCLDDTSDSCESSMHPLVCASLNGKGRRWLTSQGNHRSHFLHLHKPLNYDRQISEPIVLTDLEPPTESLVNKLSFPRRYNTSFPKQFATLFLRSFKTILRDPSLTRNALLIHLATALLVGALCYQVGEDAKYLNNRANYSSLYFSLLFLMFTAFSAVTLRFPSEMPIVRREHFNRWYSTSAYYLATIAAYAPTQVACTLLYSVIAYALTGQPLQLRRFGAYLFILTIVTLIAMCVGLLNGTIFNLKHGAVFGPFFIMPFVIFSGYFLRYVDSPGFFLWLFHISFINHGLVGLCVSIFGWERQELPCTDDFCFIIRPDKYLDFLGLEGALFGLSVLWLSVIWVIVVIAAYVILRLRLKYKS